MNTQLINVHKEVITKSTQKIKRIVAPIKTYFELSYFSYQKITNDRLYTLITDRADYIEHYIEDELYRHDLFIHHPQFTNEGLFYFPIPTGSNEHRDLNHVIENCSHSFGINQQLVITAKYDSYYEIFCLATARLDKKVIPQFMNELDLLTRYFAYFRKKSLPLQNQCDEMKIDIAKIKGDKFFEENPLEKFRHKNKRELFLNHLSNTFHYASLTNRQTDCLYYLVKGLTMKQIAAKLNLSAKTVEHYLDTVKNKLNCYTRSDLVEKALQIQTIRSRL